MNRDSAARALVRDQTINEAFEAVKAALVQDLLNAPTPEERERIHQEWKAVDRVRGKLGHWATNKTLEGNP